MTEGAPREISDKQIRDIVENTKDTSRQESHTKPNGNSLKNRIAAGMAAFAIATGVGATATGCEAKFIPTETIESTVESSETTEQSVTVTPTETTVKVDPVGTTETTETTPAPTETTVETTAPTETDVNVELAEAPEISGLSKEIEDGKVVYKAVEGNEYGIEAGEFAGEYNANVSVEGSRVGGVILEPEVITKIMGDKSEIIPPLDITGVTAETGLNIVNTTDLAYTEFFSKNYQTVMIEFNGQLELINPFIEENQFNTIDEMPTNMEFRKNDETTISFKNQAGMVSELALRAIDIGRTEMGMEDYYYAFNADNINEINNFNQEKIYKTGEKTGVLIDSNLAIYYDYFNCQETTTENLARTEEGAVIFAYPQEATEAGK